MQTHAFFAWQEETTFFARLRFWPKIAYDYTMSTALAARVSSTPAATWQKGAERCGMEDQQWQSKPILSFVDLHSSVTPYDSGQASRLVLLTEQAVGQSSYTL